MLPKAPPLSGTDWLNSEPLSIAHLRGRPVVILFWAASCEGSWVRLRQLEDLSARHGDALAVVAIHSPRFDFERDVLVVAQDVATRSVTVPVLHDPTLDTWARYGPQGRPTVVVLDHRHRVVGAMVGTDPASVDALSLIADEQVALARAAGSRPSLPSTWTAPEPAPRRPGSLHGPASLARMIDGTVAVADRGNGRLILLDIDPIEPSARVARAFGATHGIGHLAARTDGSLAVSFPDRGTVERIDVETKSRTTIAEGLVRPLGLIEDRDGSLVIADAGSDQLVRVSPERTGPIAGTDREPISQPRAVTRIEAGLLFVEASTGAIRLLTDEGRIQTINDGAKAGLYDGPAHMALFQHPTDVALLDDGAVAVADCGNSRLRLLADRKVSTLPVTGLVRPESLLYLGGRRLLCCDTGNDRLVIVDLENHRADELTLDGLPV